MFHSDCVLSVYSALLVCYTYNAGQNDLGTHFLEYKV